MIKFLILFLFSFSTWASYSPQTIVTDATSGFTAKVNAAQELAIILAADSNVCKETGGNLASILSQLQSSIAVTGTFFQATQPVSAASLPLPANAAKETGGNLDAIYTKLLGSIAVTGTFWQATQPISAVSLPLPTGAASQTTLAAILSALGSPFQAGGSIGNTAFGISGTLPAFTSTPTFNVGTTGGVALDSTVSALSAKFNSLGQKTSANSAPVTIASDQSAIPVTVASVPLPTGAATETTLAAINTKIPASPAQEHATAGSPSSVRLTDGTTFYTGFKSGDVIGNTAFIANAGTNLNTSALSLEATQSAFKTANHTDLTLINTTLGSPMQNSGGSVTANAGTNLNTSLLALEGGGHLASIDTKVATAANQTTANSSLASIVTNTTGLATATAQASILANQTNGTQKTQVTSLPSDAAPATQNITAQDVATVTTAQANGQSVMTGTPTAGSAATFSVSSAESVEVQVTGTWTGTLVSEMSYDGSNWFTRGVKQAGVSYITSTFTQNFEGGGNITGVVNYRVRSTAAWTGTATVKAIFSNNATTLTISTPLTIRDATVQSISNTVKAASTAALATDTAIVVGLSPNSPVPTGTNTIGAVTKAGTATSQIIRNDYGSVSVTTAAYVQLVASTSNVINTLWVSDTSGQDFVLATGGAGSEVDQIQIPPGGWDSPVTLNIPAGTRISIKAKSASATAGILNITGLK